MPKFQFAKYNGCGNDFILIDNRNHTFPSADHELIQRLCHRHFGIGADGCILLENSLNADIRMRIFNSDGLEAEMCGNGVRCLVDFANTLGISKVRYSIETMQRRLNAVIREKNISVSMGAPLNMRWHIPIKIDNQLHHMHHLDTGVPHLIWFTDDHQSINLSTWGPQLRFHQQFAPKGANVNVVTISADGNVLIRTYERGVEKETLGCGTGCTAAALAAATLKGLPSPIQVRSPGGEVEISFKWCGGNLTDIEMTGTADHVYSGQINIPIHAEPQNFSQHE